MERESEDSPCSLLHCQQAFYEVHVRLRNFAVDAHYPLALLRLFGEDVPFKRLLVRDFSGASHFEALLGRGVCFYLRH